MEGEDANGSEGTVGRETCNRLWWWPDLKEEAKGTTRMGTIGADLREPRFGNPHDN